MTVLSFDRLAFKLTTALCLLFLLVPLTPVCSQPVLSEKEVRIGILLDVEKRETSGFIRRLESEITNLLETKYTVKIEETDILRCNWSVDCIERNYQRLVNDAHSGGKRCDTSANCRRFNQYTGRRSC